MTDYLKDKFPNYVLTGDTSAKEYKNYFRKNGGSFDRIVGTVTIPSPNTTIYEFKENHNEEFRHNVASHQVNNVATVCTALGEYLLKFPDVTLPRTTTVDGQDIDWSTTYFDTVWNERVGVMVAPPFVVPFSTNMYFARNINKLVNDISLIIHNLGTSAGWSSIASSISAFVNAANATVANGYRYVDYGYKFDISTIGNSTREDDVYTCATCWEEVDWRGSLMILQNARDAASAGTVSSRVNQMNNIIECFDACARTMVDICQRTAYIRLVNARELECKMVDAPKQLTFNGTTYYRLEYTSQFDPDAYYGEARASWNGTVSIFSVRQFSSPVAVFNHLNLDDYNPIITLGNTKSIPLSDVQNGRLWYTNVPFEGH